jgi:pimeloyl-ACP methyl ester carboxylesterase
MTQTERPEIGTTVDAGGIKTNYLEAGAGPAVILVHGSGPGVTAYANWRLVIPDLSQEYRVIAPDMVGFGFTDRPDDVEYTLETWVRQVIGLMDSLGLQSASIVGNSFGGGIALRIASRYPERVDKLVLMGSMGVGFELTEGLNRVWGYTPSFQNMRGVLDVFAHNRELVPDELAEVRYRASMQPGFQDAFEQIFPEPRQQGVEAMRTPDDDIRRIPHRALIVHGREDQVIPVETSLQLFRLLDRGDLHIFSHCGHWSQIERSAEFNRLVRDFLADRL